MRIDGITCCVGEKYAELLSQSIGTWLETLDSLTIVTSRSDSAVQALWRRFNESPKLNLVATDVFYEYGATFNKAAALCEAYAVSQPTDWCLHFDSDIVPPVYWRKHAERRIQPGNLYGAFRFSPEGVRLDEFPLFPYGYFHLWNVMDPHSWNWPIFEYWHPHAGNYDSEFALQWPASNRRDLGFSVTHLGEPRSNWFGPNGDGMEQLRSQGLYQTRILAKAGAGILHDIPEPKLRLQLVNAEEDPLWARRVLDACAIAGSRVTANVSMSTLDRLRKKTSSDFYKIDPGMTVDSIQGIILDAKYDQVNQVSHAEATGEAL